VRVPFADVGPMVIPEWLSDEDALLLTDAFSTGYFGAQLGDIVEGDTVVVLGAGPVGLAAARSAWLMGAGRVISIDQFDYRLDKAVGRDIASEVTHVIRERWSDAADFGELTEAQRALMWERMFLNPGSVRGFTTTIGL
jgi:threonine dehydrogenase-like Zn-dependent dehydrogenase